MWENDQNSRFQRFRNSWSKAQKIKRPSKTPNLRASQKTGMWELRSAISLPKGQWSIFRLICWPWYLLFCNFFTHPKQTQNMRQQFLAVSHIAKYPICDVTQCLAKIQKSTATELHLDFFRSDSCIGTGSLRWHLESYDKMGDWLTPEVCMRNTAFKTYVEILFWHLPKAHLRWYWG